VPTVAKTRLTLRNNSNRLRSHITTKARLNLGSKSQARNTPPKKQMVPTDQTNVGKSNGGMSLPRKSAWVSRYRLKFAGPRRGPARKKISKKNDGKKNVFLYAIIKTRTHEPTSSRIE
jgi:hypothetical protein